MDSCLPPSVLHLGRQIVSSLQNALSLLSQSELGSTENLKTGQLLVRQLSELMTRQDLLRVFPGLAELLAHNNALVGALENGSRPDVIRQARLSVEDTTSSLDDLLTRGASPINRIDLLKRIVEKTHAKSYLEIGCNTNECFSSLEVARKVGVDPVMGGTLRMTSDEFFKDNTETFDVIFIDGLHEATQALKDLENSLAILNAGGVIVMHDCNPAYEVRQITPAQTGVWNGDVWKSFLVARSNANLDTAVADLDHGCGLVMKRTRRNPVEFLAPPLEMTWREFADNRNRYLNIISWDEVEAWLS